MKRFHKHKVLLDEHMEYREKFPLLNELFDVKHISFDLNHAGADDETVYNLAISQNRIVITRNVKDFRPLIHSGDPGVIGMPANLRPEQVDTKLTALLKKHGPKYFTGKYIPFGGEKGRTK